MNIKCLFGFYDWRKLGGPQTVGTAKIKQRFRCKRCGDVKTEIR